MNEDNENRLYAAAKFGTLEDVKAAFLACSADERKKYGYETLHFAEMNPSSHTLGIMKFLIEQGAKPNPHTITRQIAPGSDGLHIMKLFEDNDNQLYAAAKFGTLEDVKKAFEACSYDERKSYGYWTLLNAARNIHPCALEVVKYLIERGVEPNSNTLSHAAGNSGPCALGIVKYLIERGVEPNSDILSDAARNSGPRALEVAKYLIERGVEPKYFYTLPNAAGNSGPYALGIVKYLIERGVEPNSDILSDAARNSGPRALEVVKYLIERGVEPNSDTLCSAAGNSGPCALEVVKYLIERGVEPNSNTLSHAAGNSGPYALKIVEFLMEHHDRPGCPIDIDSETLLEAARNCGPCATKIVEFLKGRGLNADLLTLFCAVSNTGPCALEIVKYLIERDIKPNAYIFCEAAKNSGPFALDIVKLLIERGVDRHERDYYESTAFLEALDYGNTDICDYLLSRDDFYLSDLMPRQQILPMSDDDPYTDEIYIKPNIDETYIKYKGESKTYITYRGKVISKVSELIDVKGPSYARTVAADIKKILEENEELEPPEEDIEALQPLIKKIASIDWVGDAQVSCDDLLGCDVER